MWYMNYVSIKLLEKKIRSLGPVLYVISPTFLRAIAMIQVSKWNSAELPLSPAQSQFCMCQPLDREIFLFSRDDEHSDVKLDTEVPGLQLTQAPAQKPALPGMVQCLLERVKLPVWGPSAVGGRGVCVGGASEGNELPT